MIKDKENIPWGRNKEAWKEEKGEKTLDLEQPTPLNDGRWGRKHRPLKEEKRNREKNLRSQVANPPQRWPLRKKAPAIEREKRRKILDLEWPRCQEAQALP